LDACAEVAGLVSSKGKEPVKLQDEKPKPKRVPLRREEDVESTATSCIIVEDTMYEQVLMDGKKPAFVYISKKGMIAYCDKVIDEAGLKYVPLQGEEITKKTISLPSKAITFVAGDIPLIIKQVEELIREYCDLPEWMLRLAPYWVLGTYVYDQFNEYPYLSFQGDTGTGKTRMRDVIGMMCYKPIICNGGTTAPAAYRLIEKWKGTMLMDEVDQKHSDETNDFIRMLNCGWSKNAPVIKCDLDNNNALKFYNPYCPKILARRKEFFDKATESRCISVITYETSKQEFKEKNLGKRFEERVEEIRNKLTTFRLIYWKKFTTPETNPLGNLNIEPRTMQAYQSIAIVLLPFPEAYEDFKQRLITTQRELIEVRAETIQGQIVQAVYDLEQQGNPFKTSSMICDQIGDEKLRNATVGKILRSLGFTSQSIKRDGRVQREVSILPGKWKALKRRYIPELTVTEVTEVTAVTGVPPENNQIDQIVPKTINDYSNSKKSIGTDTAVTAVLPVTGIDKTATTENILHLIRNNTKQTASLEDIHKTFTNSNEEYIKERIIHLMGRGEIFETKLDTYQVLN